MVLNLLILNPKFNIRQIRAFAENIEPTAGTNTTDYFQLFF
jgi:hypothetical protein